MVVAYQKLQMDLSAQFLQAHTKKTKCHTLNLCFEKKFKINYKKILILPILLATDFFGTNFVIFKWEMDKFIFQLYIQMIFADFLNFFFP
jgi:hypothetical protein